MQVFLATNNEGKIERYKYLLRYVASDIDVYTPADLSIPVIDVVENGKTLAENAKLKAHAYVGLVDMPIVSNDTGFMSKGRDLSMHQNDERSVRLMSELSRKRRLGRGYYNFGKMLRQNMAEGWMPCGLRRSLRYIQMGRCGKQDLDEK